MKKTLYTLFTAIAIACMAFGVMLMTNASVAKADVVPGATPTFSSTKYLKSTDETMMIVATGINNYQDCYELGYEIEGATAVTYNTAKYYTSISLNGGANIWTVQDLFDGYTGMIVWEVEYDKYYDVSFQAYVKVGNREDGVLVETDTVVCGTEKTVASKVMLNTGFDISLPDYDPATATKLEFDVYLANAGTKFRFRLYDGDEHYFGDYYLYGNGTFYTTGGWNYAGVTCQSLGDNNYHFVMTLGNLIGGSNTTPGKLVRLADNGSSANLDGAWIDNIRFCEPAGKVMLESGFDIRLPDYNPATAITLEFDVYVTEERSAYAKVYWNLCDADNNYFGYYRVTYAGPQATNGSGYSVTSISADNIIHVTLVLSELAGGSGTPGKLVKLKDNGQSVNLDGCWIDNIQFCEPAGKVMLESGFDVRLPDYDPANVTTLEFDLYVTDARSPYTKVYWNLYDANNNYFGYYRVTYAGLQATNTSGYSIESIGTDTFHVTLVLSELAGGSGTPGKLVRLADNGSSVNLDGAWIDNIEFN